MVFGHWVTGGLETPEELSEAVEFGSVEKSQ